MVQVTVDRPVAPPASYTMVLTSTEARVLLNALTDSRWHVVPTLDDIMHALRVAGANE